MLVAFFVTAHIAEWSKLLLILKAYVIEELRAI